MKAKEFIDLIDSNLNSMNAYNSIMHYRHINSFYKSIEEPKESYTIEDPENVSNDLKQAFNGFNVYFSYYQLKPDYVFMVIKPTGDFNEDLKEAMRNFLIDADTEPTHIFIDTLDLGTINYYNSKLKSIFKNVSFTQFIEENSAYNMELSKLEQLPKSKEYDIYDVCNDVKMLVENHGFINYSKTGNEGSGVSVLEYYKLFDDTVNKILREVSKNRIKRVITYSGEYSDIEIKISTFLFLELYLRSNIHTHIMIPEIIKEYVVNEYRHFILNESTLLKEEYFYNLMNIPRVLVNTKNGSTVRYLIQNIDLNFSVKKFKYNNNTLEDKLIEEIVSYDTYNILSISQEFRLNSTDSSDYMRANNAIKNIINKFYDKGINRKGYISVTDLVMLEDKITGDRFICYVDNVDFKAIVKALSVKLKPLDIEVGLDVIKNSIPAGMYINKNSLISDLISKNIVDLRSVNRDKDTYTKIFSELLIGNNCYSNNLVVYRLFRPKTKIGYSELSMPVINYYKSLKEDLTGHLKLRATLKNHSGLSETRNKVDCFGLFNLMINYEVEI